MPKKRRQFSGEFKAKVALEAIRGERTINEIAAEHGVHPNQVSQWKSQLLENLPGVFSGERDAARQDAVLQKERDELYRQIGQLKVEIDWLKKKTDPYYRGQASDDRAGEQTDQRASAMRVAFVQPLGVLPQA